MTKDQELLAWAAAEIAKEQENKTYGSITIHLEAGTITRSEVKRLAKPDVKRNS